MSGVITIPVDAVSVVMLAALLCLHSGHLGTELKSTMPTNPPRVVIHIFGIFWWTYLIVRVVV